MNDTNHGRDAHVIALNDTMLLGNYMHRSIDYFPFDFNGRDSTPPRSKLRRFHRPLSPGIAIAYAKPAFVQRQ